MSIRVVCIDSETLLCEGLKAICECTDDIEILACSSSIEQTEALAKQYNPDIIIIESAIVEGSCLELVKTVVEKCKAAVVVLAPQYDKVLSRKCRNVGAAGYIVPSCSKTDVIGALQTIVQEGTWFDNGRDDQSECDTELRDIIARLSKQHRAVLRYAALGYGIKKTATAMNLCNQTVANYRSELKKKLNVQTVNHMVRVAIENGIED